MGTKTRTKKFGIQLNEGIFVCLRECGFVPHTVPQDLGEGFRMVPVTYQCHWKGRVGLLNRVLRSESLSMDLPVPILRSRLLPPVPLHGRVVDRVLRPQTSGGGPLTGSHTGPEHPW